VKEGAEDHPGHARSKAVPSPSQEGGGTEVGSGEGYAYYRRISDIPVGDNESGECALAQLEGEDDDEGHIGHQQQFIDHGISSSRRRW